MDWLNYHHLLYFWVVAREGTIARACEQLHLTQPSISKQLHQLEHSVGEKLFQRVGRNLVLTETGQLVFRYADEIFSLGRELSEALRGKPSRERLRLLVGVADVVPKLIAYRVLEPALHLPEPVQLMCDERGLVELLAELAEHRLDLVLSDSPLPPTSATRAYNHLLGECGVCILGSSSLAQKFRRGFPQSLDGAPFLLPTRKSMLRRSLDQWFDAQNIRPELLGEFDDSAVESVRPGRSGALPRPSGGGTGDVPAIPRTARRPARRGAGTLLCHLCRAKAEAPRGESDHRSRPEHAVPVELPRSRRQSAGERYGVSPCSKKRSESKLPAGMLRDAFHLGQDPRELVRILLLQDRERFGLKLGQSRGRLSVVLPAYRLGGLHRLAVDLLQRLDSSSLPEQVAHVLNLPDSRSDLRTGDPGIVRGRFREVDRHQQPPPLGCGVLRHQPHGAGGLHGQTPGERSSPARSGPVPQQLEHERGMPFRSGTTA